MLLLQLISSVLLGIVFMKLDLFPVLYQIIMVIVLFIMLAIPLALQKNAFTRVCAILFSLIISAVFVMGSFYLWKTHKMLDDITVEDTETTLEDVTIVVLAEDAAQSINDTKEYTYGIQKVIDRENTDVTLQSIEAHLKSDIDVKEYESLLTQVEALYSKEVGAIILNEKFRTLIVEEYEDFDTETRVLSSYRYETPEININKNNNKLPEDGAFCVFLSGIDTFGEISTVSRSDVNIIAVVNPKSKQVLLLTTPRDYYVELPLFEGCMDKLTHAGVYGIETSMETLENLYDIEIQNYARINFTGFQTMKRCGFPKVLGTLRHKGFPVLLS